MNGALASRLAQAEGKEWTKLTKETAKRIKKLVWPHLSEQKPKRDNKSLTNFFTALASAKGKFNR